MEADYKNAVLISTLHRDGEFSDCQHCMPVIILDHNGSRSVDNLESHSNDKPCHGHFRFFYNILDGLEYNAFVIWMVRQGTDNTSYTV